MLDLMMHLDTDGDGQIDYKEFVRGREEFLETRRKSNVGGFSRW